MSGATGDGAPRSGQLGLRSRPVPDPAVLAAIAASAEAVLRPVVVVAESRPVRPAWRFSGRWWAKPVVVRRDRPWA